MEATRAEYFEFPSAGYVAFERLQSGRSSLIYVIPSSNGAGWRLIEKINKSALRSKDKRNWVTLWEAVCLERSPEDRQNTFHRLLHRLVREQNSTALRAQTEIDLDLQKKKRSPGFQEGAALFQPFLPDQPMYRG